MDKGRAELVIIVFGLAIFLAVFGGVAAAEDVPENLMRGVVDAESHSKDNIISDVEYRNYQSMSLEQIQSFLENPRWGDDYLGRPSYLATYTTTDYQGVDMSAAEIIYNAARDYVSQGYQISPEVILTTLQKEQSLITDSNPTETQLNWAMGYDSYGDYLGFGKQVDAGGWQLGYNYKSIQDHGNKNGWGVGISKQTLDGVTIIPQNIATACLYDYTPHAGAGWGGSGGGNYLFWDLYYNQFGFETSEEIAKTLDVPYIHQTYDASDEFVGTWACAPTSAVMILAYYERISPDPIWVSWPSPGHYSDYEKYISREYTYDGYTFSNVHTESTGCGTATGKGAWGYIWKDSSSSCVSCGVITNLQEYLRLHDFNVDFHSHPTETEARNLVQKEIDEERPLIARTKLTGGHYVVVIGYEINANGDFWYKINDPFGDYSYYHNNPSTCWGCYIIADPQHGNPQCLQPVKYSYSQMNLGYCDGGNCRGLITIQSSGGEDNIPPTVDAFSVSPDFVTQGNSFTISYTVSDDKGLKQTELWRAIDVDGVPDWGTYPEDNPKQITPLSGQTSYSGSFSDAPPSVGIYWYGIHVVDNAGYWNDERNSQTGGLPGVFGPIKVEVYEQPECTSGPCCDTSTNKFRPSSHKCQEDVTPDYGCPWGTGCGDNVGVRHEDRYCSGSSAQCDGALQWDSWTVADSCDSTEVCVDNDPTCNYEQSCSTSQNTGWKSPSANGENYNEWLDSENAYTSNNQYATISYSSYLQDYYNFNFNIPDNVIIEGIEVRIEAHGEGDTGKLKCRLKNAFSSGVYSDLFEFNEGSDSLDTKGGPNEFWGLFWSASDFADDIFRLECISHWWTGTIKVDNIQTRVYYTEAVCTETDTSCGVYPNCENCDDYDGCEGYGNGCEERDYYCDTNNVGCKYIYSNRNTDNWHNKGSSYSCCDGDKACTCQEQEYQDYYCSGTSCTYTITQTRAVKYNCVSCNDNNPCTDDGCDSLTAECVFVNDDNNVCGVAQDCPVDNCDSNPPYEHWLDYPDDGHDYCQSGFCTVYSCELLSSTYKDTCDPDDDNDNIADESDNCPDTTEGAIVDPDGCSCAQKTCDDQNPCTDDICNPESAECTYTIDDANICGEPRDCPQDHCNTEEPYENWLDYPDDGHDYCQSGSCIIYSCTLKTSTYNETCDPDDDNDGDPDITDCEPNNPDIYNGAPELCDGLDNDCDDETDEDFTNLGNSCTAGIGACERTGEYICAIDGLATECNSIPGDPTEELCDGLDNDCNGQTDEGFDQDDCSENCDYVWTALGGVSNCCGDDNGEGNPYETTEKSCSDLHDNDCDGYTDQGDSDCLSDVSIISFNPSKSIITLGSNTKINITIDEVPDGLSGYNLTVLLSNTSIADIISITYPSWATLHENSKLPSDSVWMKSVDLSDQITSGDTNVILGTLIIRANKEGTSDVTISVTKIDDDNGYSISTNTVSAILNVTMVVQFPDNTNPPTDPDGDGLYEDINGNGRIDFDDVVQFFKYLEWVEPNQPNPLLFDFNTNGRIDFDDIRKLFNEV